MDAVPSLIPDRLATVTPLGEVLGGSWQDREKVGGREVWRRRAENSSAGP